MAVIAQTSTPARVYGKGDAKSANVSLSGGIMEMLATVYSNILMSSIREAIQNACDAARRAGLSFQDGVFVTLPTAENPLITVLDKGSGMTKAFMEADDGYMSFGVSTKAGDNNESGGLGVGRWAAYGYIRECIIKTTHASDMVERSYFQFQGEGNMPQVQCALERPGMTETGTMVSFPIRKEEVQEAHRAVAWLQSIMQLTMKDSFSVDAPAALVAATTKPAGASSPVFFGLPEFSGVVLELESFDPSLKGVRLYPMMGPNLQYGTKGLGTGSLVVLTNQERGVGGLPFHVKGSGESAFSAGMIVEIPMSFAVPFMPSREELKYTPQVNALMDTIDAAARRAAVAKAEELFTTPGLEPKKVLTKLVDIKNGHFMSAAMHGKDTQFSQDMKKAVGNVAWSSRLSLEGFDFALRTTVKVRRTLDDTLGNAYISSGTLYRPQAGDRPAERVMFNIPTPPTLVVNDLPSGGVARFRMWATSRSEVLVLIDAEETADAIAQAMSVNAFFGNELTVLKTSDMPAAAKRVIRGSTVSRSMKSAMVFHRCASSSYHTGKQETETMSFLTPDSTPGSLPRVWIGKEGRRVFGLNDTTAFSDLTTKDFEKVLKAAGQSRIFFLTGSQIKELNGLIASVKEAGAWDASEAEFEDLDVDLAFSEVQALKLWMPVEDMLANLVDSGEVKSVLSGTHLHTVVDHNGFNGLIANLARAPRMELTGSRLDKQLSPHFDLLTGERKLPRAKLETFLLEVCIGLAYYGTAMETTDADPDARKELKETLMSLKSKGTLEAKHVWEALVAEFPMLQFLATSSPETAVNDLSQAMALMYR